MEEISKTVKEILLKLQRKSNKLIKKQTCRLIPEIFENMTFNHDSIRFFFEGDDDLVGICELSGVKNSINEFKQSSSSILNIVHYLLVRSNNKDFFQQIFSELDPFTIQKMKLGEHFLKEYKYNVKDKLEIPLEIAKVISDKRPYLDLSEVIEDEETLDIMRNFFKLLKSRKNSMKKKVFRFFGAFILNISRECLFVEPSTWDEVLMSFYLRLNYQRRNYLMLRKTLWTIRLKDMITSLLMKKSRFRTIS